MVFAFCHLMFSLSICMKASQPTVSTNMNERCKFQVEMLNEKLIFLLIISIKVVIFQLQPTVLLKYESSLQFGPATDLTYQSRHQFHQIQLTTKSRSFVCLFFLFFSLTAENQRQKGNKMYSTCHLPSYYSPSYRESEMALKNVLFN